jgi:excisionase family DNA binding protein
MAVAEPIALPVFFTPQQVMAMLDLSRDVVYGMLASGRLRSARVGRKGTLIRIPAEAIQDLIDSGTTPVVAADEDQESPRVPRKR